MAANKKYFWIIEGSIWAIISYTIVTFVFPIIWNETIDWAKATRSIPVWLIVGLGYGITMKKIRSKSNKNKV